MGIEGAFDQVDIIEPVTGTDLDGLVGSKVPRQVQGALGPIVKIPKIDFGTPTHFSAVKGMKADPTCIPLVVSHRQSHAGTNPEWMGKAFELVFNVKREAVAALKSDNKFQTRVASFQGSLVIVVVDQPGLELEIANELTTGTRPKDGPGSDGPFSAANRPDSWIKIGFNVHIIDPGGQQIGPPFKPNLSNPILVADSGSERFRQDPHDVQILLQDKACVHAH